MKKAQLLVLALMMTFGLAACGNQAANSTAVQESTSKDNQTTENATPAKTGMTTNGLYPGTADADSVTTNIGAEPPDMNSVTTTDSTAISIMRDTLEGLVMLNQENEVIPGVAESWDISDDKMTYTFHLRDNAMWSNGDKVTANDFVFAWTQLFTSQTGAQYAGTWAPYIKGAKEMLETGDASNFGVVAEDEKTLKVTLTSPTEYFLSVLAFPNFYPINEAFWNEVGGVDKYGRDADKMLYNGPYMMSEWQHEDHVTIKKNDKYWDKANKAFIPTVNMVMIAESGAALNSFQGGEVDMIGLSGEQRDLLKSEGVVTGEYMDGAVAYLEFNTLNGKEGSVSSDAVGKALGNAKVRRALTLAVDVESYLKNVAKSSSSVADGIVTPSVANGEYAKARGSLIDRSKSSDELKALLEEGLKEAGVSLKDFKPVLSTDEGDNALKMVTFIQNEWKTKLGVEMTVEQLPFKNRLDKMSKKTYDIVVSLWGPDYDDPMTYLDIMASTSGNNHTGWANKDFDNLLKQAYLETDSQKRQQFFIDAEKLLMEEMPVGPLYFRARDYIVSDKMTGVVRNAFQDTLLKYAKLAK